MDRIGEMFRAQELGDPLERAVAHQDGAEQGLLRFEIMRRRAV
jgi:hypothetical protein